MTRWVFLSPSPLPRAADVSFGSDLPGSIGGLGFSGDCAAEPPTVPGIDAAPLAPPVAGHVDPALTGRRVRRTLLLTVRAGTPDRELSRFESDLLGMPAHIPAIRSWALSRVDRRRAPGSRWTHAWEQEFADLSGLTGDYLLHPYHWAYVDRWFDSELPTSIVHPGLAHVFRWADGPVPTSRER